MKAKYQGFLAQIAIALVSALFMAGCSGDVSYEEALDENQQDIEDPKTVEDARFLVEAKSLNLLGIKLAELAADSGYSSALVEFAGAHLEQDENMAEDLKDLARKKNLTLPTEMSAAHESLYYELSSASRKDFDGTYVRIARNINSESKSLYSRHATDANDPDIRAFAARKVGELEANLQEIKKIEEQLIESDSGD